MSLLVVNGMLQHIGSESDRALAKSQAWTNVVTGKTVQLPPAWIPTTQKNDDGDRLDVFSAPMQGVYVIFAKEDTNNRLSLQDYAAAWQRAVASAMTLEPTSSSVSMDGKPVWQGSGHMVADHSQRVLAFLAQRGSQVWRVIIVGASGGSVPATAETLQLKDTLLSSL
jgi:hypothetical protein